MSDALDIGFQGYPFAESGGSDSLDIGFQGYPFATPADTPASVDCAVTTGQGQTASGVAGDAAAPVDATVATSQAQGSSGAGDVTATPWTISNAVVDLIDDPDGDGTANYSFTGNTLAFGPVSAGHTLVVIVFGYWRSDGSTITVSDNAGHSYTAGTQHVGDGTPTVNARGWAQAFYANGIGDHAGLTISVDIASTGTVQDLLARLHIAAFEVDKPALQIDAESFKHVTGSTSVTSDAFNLSAPGGIFAAELNFTEDSITGSTVNFEADYTDLTRPGRLASTGFPDATYGAAGYRATTGALTGEQVTFTGNASSSRWLLAVAMIEGEVLPTGAAATSQVQGTSGEASVTGIVETDSTAATQQGQTVSVAGSVSSDAVVATQQAQGSAAEGEATGDSAVLTRQGQSAAGEIALGTPIAVATEQGQGATAEAAVGVDSSAVTSQGQSTEINGSTGVLASVSTLSGQSAAGQLQAAHVATGATGQAQGNAATGYTLIAVAVVGRQGQSSAGTAGTAIAFAAATKQGQTSDGDARAESDQTVITKQGQHVSGALVLNSVATVATKQGQQAGAAVGTAIDCAVTTGQGQRMGQGLSLLHIVLDSAGSTAQAQGQAGTLRDSYTPQLGDLTACIVFRAAVAGYVDAKTPTSAIIRTDAAVRGHIETRPV